MQDKKKRSIQIGVLIASVVLIVFSITYAFVNTTLFGTKRQALNAGKLELLLEEGEEIQIQDALPMFDEVGMIQKPFVFHLVNNSGYNTRYILKLVVTIHGLTATKSAQ